jgi:gas vesicle protein
MATCQIGNKVFQLWQVIAGVIGGVLLLIGAAWGMLEADDRWNQKFFCNDNQEDISEIEADVAMLANSIQKQDARNDYEFWKRQVYVIEEQVRRYPNNNQLRQQLQEAKENLREAQERYLELKSR